MSLGRIGTAFVEGIFDGTGLAQGMFLAEQNARRAAERIENNFNRANRSTTNLRAGFRSLGYQISDTVAQIARGQAPLRALTEQGLQAAAAFGPAAIAVSALAAAVVGGIAAWLNYTSASQDAQDAADRTKEKLDTLNGLLQTSKIDVDKLGDALRDATVAMQDFIVAASHQALRAMDDEIIALTANVKELGDKFRIAVEQADIFGAAIFGGGLGAVSAELQQLAVDFQNNTISAETFLRTLYEITADVPVAAQTVLRKLGEEAVISAGDLQKLEETARRLRNELALFDELSAFGGAGPDIKPTVLRSGTGAAGTPTAPALTPQQRRLQQGVERFRFETGPGGRDAALAEVSLEQAQATAAADFARDQANQQRAADEFAATLRDQEALAQSLASSFSDLAQTAAFEGLDQAAQQFLKTLIDVSLQALFFQGIMAAFGFFTGGASIGAAGAATTGAGGAGFSLPFFGGPRQHGGPVSAGQNYFVGEAGREIFRPASAGTIIPNHMIGTQFSTTIDARGAHAGIGAEISRALTMFERRMTGMLDDRDRRSLGSRRRA